ncbi:MAG: hypothetical protein NTW55_06795 [Planctomycetota bacterium]|nr:hypothetical protein [Planctomycetota bacterium]
MQNAIIKYNWYNIIAAIVIQKTKSAAWNILPSCRRTLIIEIARTPLPISIQKTLAKTPAMLSCLLAAGSVL